jgi:hypothetical protein
MDMENRDTSVLTFGAIVSLFGAYREFHRILSHKEYFSRQDEQDNIKRLETPKW